MNYDKPVKHKIQVTEGYIAKFANTTTAALTTRKNHRSSLKNFASRNSTPGNPAQ